MKKCKQTILKLEQILNFGQLQQNLQKKSL